MRSCRNNLGCQAVTSHYIRKRGLRAGIHVIETEHELFEPDFDKTAARLKDDPSLPTLEQVMAFTNGGKYKVQSGHRSMNQAAEILAMVDDRNKRLIEYLKARFPDDRRTKRLASRYRSTHLFESKPLNGRNLTSYTMNKEIIGFCVRHKHNPSAVIRDINLIMFVSVHEMSHMASDSVGHNDEFKRNFRWLLDRALEAKIYIPVNYAKTPVQYCGLKIDHNPYFDAKYMDRKYKT